MQYKKIGIFAFYRNGLQMGNWVSQSVPESLKSVSSELLPSPRKKARLNNGDSLRVGGYTDYRHYMEYPHPDLSKNNNNNNNNEKSPLYDMNNDPDLDLNYEPINNNINKANSALSDLIPIENELPSSLEINNNNNKANSVLSDLIPIENELPASSQENNNINSNSSPGPFTSIISKPSNYDSSCVVSIIEGKSKSKPFNSYKSFNSLAFDCYTDDETNENSNNNNNIENNNQYSPRLFESRESSINIDLKENNNEDSPRLWDTSESSINIDLKLNERDISPTLSVSSQLGLNSNNNINNIPKESRLPNPYLSYNRVFRANSFPPNDNESNNSQHKPSPPPPPQQIELNSNNNNNNNNINNEIHENSLELPSIENSKHMNVYSAPPLLIRTTKLIRPRIIATKTFSAPNIDPSYQYYNKFKLYLVARFEECEDPRSKLKKRDVIREEFTHLYKTDARGKLAPNKLNNLATMVYKWVRANDTTKLNYVSQPQSMRNGGGGRPAKIPPDLKRMIYKVLVQNAWAKQAISPEVLKIIMYDTINDSLDYVAFLDKADPAYDKTNEKHILLHPMDSSKYRHQYSFINFHSSKTMYDPRVLTQKMIPTLVKMLIYRGLLNIKLIIFL